MTDALGDLERQGEEFGQELADLLTATLPDLPDPAIDVLFRHSRFVIRPGSAPRGLPLFIEGRELAVLEISVACRLDSVERYLAVDRSSFGLKANLDRAPVLRVDYRRDMHTAPAAHVQVHGHRGALSHLLSRANHSSPHDMSALHIPVGGSRFRPCLEDFIQFLIVECGFDHKPNWRSHVDAGRERWRRRQAAAVVRDVPEEAARVLRELGYHVEPPTPVPQTSTRALRNW